MTARFCRRHGIGTRSRRPGPPSVCILPCCSVLRSRLHVNLMDACTVITAGNKNGAQWAGLAARPTVYGPPGPA